MGVIWIVEDQDCVKTSLASLLSAEFPVRRIASVESFRALFAIESETQLPDVVIVHETLKADSLAVMAAMHVLRAASQKCLVVVAESSHQAWLELATKLGLPRIGLNIADGFSLKAQIEGLMVVHRSRIVMDRVSGSERDVIEFGDVTFNRPEGSIHIHGATKETLLPKEAKILDVLARDVNRCITRQKLAEIVWPGVSVSDRTLDSHVSRLRRKMEPSIECCIEAVYGEGYSLRVGHDFHRE